MARVTWVYYLNRDELVRYTTEFELESSGTVDELRRRLASFIQAQGSESSLEARFIELETQHPRPITPRLGDQLVLPGSSGVSAANQTMEQKKNPVDTHRNEEQQTYAMYQPASHTNIMDRVRKWGLKYDGGKDPLSFIERVEELADCYEVSRDSIPRALPELLKDKALVWYRNNNRQWQEWEAFKRDFLKFS